MKKKIDAATIYISNACVQVEVDIIPGSPPGRRVKPDILASIHGLAPGSFPHFLKPEIISGGIHDRVIGTHGST